MWKCSLPQGILTQSRVKSHNRRVPEVAGRCSGAEQMEREEGVDVREACVRMSMQPVETKLWWWWWWWAESGPVGSAQVGSGQVGLTLPVGGMPRVDVERLLALADGGGQRQVGLHHPLLVVAVDDRLGRHGQRVALGHVLGQRGERLLGLQEVDKQVGVSRRKQQKNRQEILFSKAKVWFIY